MRHAVRGVALAALVSWGCAQQQPSAAPAGSTSSSGGDQASNAASQTSPASDHNATAAATTSPTPAAQAASEPGAPSGASASEEAPLHAMTVDEVFAGIGAHGTLAVFDVNSHARYEQSHVPGARWLAYEPIRAADLPADHATPLVFYCANEH